MQTCKAILVLALCSCAGELDRVDPASDHPVDTTAAPEIPLDRDALVRIDLEPGHAIAFFEPAPGMLSVVERTRISQEPLAIGPPTLEAIYAVARPGQPLPQLLRDAHDRARAHAGAAVPPATASWATGGGQRSQLRTASNADSFVNNGHCDARFISGYPNIASVCKINWSDGFFAAASGLDIGIMSATAEAVVGSVTLRVQAGDNIRDTEVPEGTRIQEWAFGNPPGLLLRTDILDAQGSWFHIGVQFMQCPIVNGSNIC